MKGATAMAKNDIEVVPGKQEIVMTRVFDAPRELLFKAFTDPELFAKWWGPRRLTNDIDRMDVRPGGSWRVVQRDDAGHEFPFHGVYHDVVSPQRIVQTFEFEGAPGHVLLQTATFEDLEGSTRLTMKSIFESTEDRDGMVQHGMESGAIESMERLAELLAGS
jgi:uncharacterized protein YndB with AHSA1/START domain